MTPAAAISALDRALATSGEDVILRRTVGTANQANIDVTCRAFVRGYKPDQLVGNVTQGDSMVIISPTQIVAAQWPGGQVAPVGDARLPRKGDRVVIQGRVRAVEAVAPIYLGGELVRIELTVKGTS